MRNWSDLFKILASGCLAGGVVIGLVMSNASIAVLGVTIGLSLWFLGSVCDGLAEVFEYYAAANKARKARLSAAKATAARMNRAA